MMESFAGGWWLLARIALTCALLVVLLVPAWWLAGRIQHDGTRPFFRLLCAAGLALVGYITVVNLVGRVVQQSTMPATAYFVLSAVLAVVVWRRWPAEASFASLFTSWRDWGVALLVAVGVGIPHWILTVTTPYWDEVASSAIHLTGPNQFAEGVFPPRHNAFPDIPIKYHYGFIILSGSARWLLGVPANTGIDIATIALWLFAFLFIVFWLRDLEFDNAPALWGGTTALMGGGLAWLYLKRVDAYSGFSITPTPSDNVLHTYSDTLSFAQNLLGSVRAPSAYLRNADGTISNLPWDIAAQFQQHAVGIGIPLAIFALYLFVTWQRRPAMRFPMLPIVIVTYGTLFLGHAVFGGVSAVTAGLVLLWLWFRAPTRGAFIDGIVFAVGVGVVALLNGGLLTIGAQYGASSDVLTLRDNFGYSRGGVAGFFHWNLAGFGIPMLLAIGGWVGALVSRATGEKPRRSKGARVRELTQRELAFLVITVFTLFSYFIPHFTFYSSENRGVEEFTEISKFFFTAHLGFALLSAFGVAYLLKRVHWGVLVPTGAAMAVTPLAFAYMHSTTALNSAPEHKWLGFYRAPYFRESVEEQMARALREKKRGPYDVYFDAARDEAVRGYLGEMLTFGGSVFTLTPTRYERTGSGYRLSEEVIAARMVQHGRMMRLRPGAAEDCECGWYYAKPATDLAFYPMIVRSRRDKAVAEGYFTSQFAFGPRVLYSIDKPTADLDRDIHRYWRPRVVMQAQSDWNGDGRSDLIFYDYANHKVLIGSVAIDAPVAVHDEFAQLYVGRFPGDRRADLLFARTRDTDFRLGRTIRDIVDRTGWGWLYRGSEKSMWDPEYDRWNWDTDMPMIADLNNDGFDTHIMYRASVGKWYEAPAKELAGPSLDAKERPLPFAGRFLQGSLGDLGIWSRTTGKATIMSLSNGRRVEFQWGGANPTEVLVPGDYNGDGYDEIAVWNGGNQFWYWRSAPDGPMTQFKFGTVGAVPLPSDYNGDGRVDPAYWDAAAGKIYVTFSAGRSVDMTITVPPNSIPGFVNVH